jgi:hypothetical protein
MGLWTWSLKKKEISVGEDGEEGKKKEFKEKIKFWWVKMEKKERKKKEFKEKRYF